MATIDDVVQDLKTRRDELKLRIHLGSKEAQEEWHRLEERWSEFTTKARVEESAVVATPDESSAPVRTDDLVAAWREHPVADVDATLDVDDVELANLELDLAAPSWDPTSRVLRLPLRPRSGADRRAVQLKATARGLRVLRKAPGPFTGVLPQALESLDPATLSRLDRDLGKLARILGADAPRGRIRHREDDSNAS